MPTPRTLATGLLTALVTAAGVVLPGAPASADVLISAPQHRVRVGADIDVGVWYRQWAGGPRAYRVKVVNPAGRVVLARHGKAPDHWRMWHVHAGRPGVWRTVYHAKGPDGHWNRVAYRTRAHR